MIKIIVTAGDYSHLIELPAVPRVGEEIGFTDADGVDLAIIVESVHWWPDDDAGVYVSIWGSDPAKR